MIETPIFIIWTSIFYRPSPRGPGCLKRYSLSRHTSFICDPTLAGWMIETSAKKWQDGWRTDPAREGWDDWNSMKETQENELLSPYPTRGRMIETQSSQNITICKSRPNLRGLGWLKRRTHRIFRLHYWPNPRGLGWLKWENIFNMLFDIKTQLLRAGMIETKSVSPCT